jgi:hypothetical protein
MDPQNKCIKFEMTVYTQMLKHYNTLLVYLQLQYKLLHMPRSQGKYSPLKCVLQSQCYIS